MKILMVAWYFPPTNTIAAVRLGKTAKHLHAAGHQVRVLSERTPPYRQDLPLEFPVEQVTHTSWWDVNSIPSGIKFIIGAITRPIRVGSSEQEVSKEGASLTATSPTKVEKSWIIQFFKAALNFPDSRIGWTPSAFWAGRKLIRHERPDIIFASGPPFTTLLIGYLLSLCSRIPLVVELRDRWSDDPYFPPQSFKLKWLQWLENKILGHARGITTVSEPWAISYRVKYKKPVEVIYNGFDSEDFLVTSRDGSLDRNKLRIVYTGVIYPGRRDPSPLFEAVASDSELQSHVPFDFYGTQQDHVLPLAEHFGITNLVSVHPPISHSEALKEQCAADVLLLMQWNDPKEQGNIPGKFFEYLAARRPILILGLEDGVPATIARDRGLGFCANTASELSDLLRDWISQKRAKGFIAPFPAEALIGFSRSEQVARLEAFLERLCDY